jgi:hypothetical protein
MAAPSAQTRPVGTMERYSVSRHNALFYIGIASYLTFQSSKGSFDRDSLESVLAAATEHTVARHGNLRKSLVDRTGPKPQWKDSERYLPKPRWVAASDVLTVLGEELRPPIAVDSGQFWRVSVVGDANDKDFSLVVAAHHGISDGKSSMVVLQTLAKHLALGTKEAMAADLSRDEGKNFVSLPVETICRGVKVPLRVLLWEAFENLLLPSFLRPYVSPKDYYVGSKLLPSDSPTFTSKPFTPDTLPATKLASLDLSPEEVKAVLAASKLNKTTLQGTLVAAAAQALATISAKAPSKIKVSSPVCLRSESGVPETEVVVCISSTDFETKLGPATPTPEAFWKSAREARDSVIKGKASSALYTLALLGYVEDDFDGFVLKSNLGVRNRKAASCEVSNAMAWTGFAPVTIKGSEWKVVGGGFSQSSSPMGSMINMSTVSVEGKLKIVAGTRDDGLVGAEELENVMEEMKRLLLSMSA